MHIDRHKYDTVREATIQSLQINGALTFNDAVAQAHSMLGGNFSGSISRYVTTVKLALEARGEIARVPKSSPQRLVLP